ncbi:MAG: hypothetical protein Q8M29_07435 [Bacteroidota bacterium]|nr:hypothetical protein [Bacteroidota bacterium]
MNRKLFLKQALLTSILSFFFLSLSAQSEKTFLFKGHEYDVKPNVLAFLGKEKVEEYSLKAPLKLMYFNFYTTNSYLIINELPKKRGISAATLYSASGQDFVGNEDNFDVFKTTIKPSDKNQYFKLSNKYLMVYPQGTIDRNFDTYIESLSK